MEKEWTAWYKILPPELLQVAYKSTSELAWPKDEALRVLDLLNAYDYTLLGIDAWLPTRPGPTPLPYEWNINRNPNSKKLPNTPKEFIEQFETLYGEKPVFNFCVKTSIQNTMH